MKNRYIFFSFLIFTALIFREVYNKYSKLKVNLPKMATTETEDVSQRVIAQEIPENREHQPLPLPETVVEATPQPDVAPVILQVNDLNYQLQPRLRAKLKTQLQGIEGDYIIGDLGPYVLIQDYSVEGESLPVVKRDDNDSFGLITGIIHLRKITPEDWSEISQMENIEVVNQYPHLNSYSIKTKNHQLLSEIYHALKSKLGGKVEIEILETFRSEK